MEVATVAWEGWAVAAGWAGARCSWRCRSSSPSLRNESDKHKGGRLKGDELAEEGLLGLWYGPKISSEP